MVESIFNRMSRILSAGVESSVDRLEKVGGEVVMREAIREAGRAIDQVKSERVAVRARRLLAERQQDLLSKRVGELSQKARFAIDNGRDDLAEAALSQQVECEAQVEQLGETQAEARAEEARLDEAMAALMARKSRMEESLSAYAQARSEASSIDGASRSGRSAERKVDAAEQTLARVMASAAAGAPSWAEDPTIARVAEIGTLQKSAMIAERLAGLKARRAAR